MIIQEFINGEEFSFDSFNDLNQNPILVVCKRKIKMRALETDQAITIKNDSLMQLGVELSQKLKHTGSLDVDIIIDENHKSHNAPHKWVA